MARRWNWDFEDEPRAPRSTAPPTAAAPAPARPIRSPAPHARARFRRRRAGAVLGAGLVIVLIAALSGSAHHRSAPSARTRVPVSRPAAGSPGSRGGAAANHAVAATLAYTPFIREGGGRSHDVALTFDDGPGPYTPGVLSALERAHVQATFFAIGRMERYFSVSTQREIADGDVIGDHTENHPELGKLSAREQREELLEQIARIELVGGPRPTLFRPPYGSFDATTIAELHRLRLLMVLWSADTGDYLLPGVPAIVQRALAAARPGAIVLLHDGGGDRSQTIAALPQIISGLRSRGFRLVTVPQLLADDPPSRGQPLPPSLSGD